jgi:opacity protein-like surface antigen
MECADQNANEDGVEMRINGSTYCFRRLLRFLWIDLALASLTLWFGAVTVHAQEQGLIISGSVGYSPLVGDISSRLNNGWHVTVDGGYNFTSHFSTTLEYMYNGYGVSRRVLNEAQVPDGNAHLWAITVNPKLRLSTGDGSFTPYVVGGVGYYRRTIEFTTPVAVPVFIFDPFFGVFYNTLVSANQVLGDITRGGIGGSAGAGFEVKLGNSGVKIFTEARYHYADTGRIPTRMVPVTFGINLTPELWHKRH